MIGDTEMQLVVAVEAGLPAVLVQALESQLVVTQSGHCLSQKRPCLQLLCPWVLAAHVHR